MQFASEVVNFVSSGIFSYPRNIIRKFISASKQYEWEIVYVKFFGFYVI